MFWSVLLVLLTTIFHFPLFYNYKSLWLWYFTNHQAFRAVSREWGFIIFIWESGIYNCGKKRGFGSIFSVWEINMCHSGKRGVWDPRGVRNSLSNVWEIYWVGYLGVSCSSISSVLVGILGWYDWVTGSRILEIVGTGFENVGTDVGHYNKNLVKSIIIHALRVGRYGTHMRRDQQPIYEVVQQKFYVGFSFMMWNMTIKNVSGHVIVTSINPIESHGLISDRGYSGNNLMTTLYMLGSWHVFQEQEAEYVTLIHFLYMNEIIDSLSLISNNNNSVFVCIHFLNDQAFIKTPPVCIYRCFGTVTVQYSSDCAPKIPDKWRTGVKQRDKQFKKTGESGDTHASSG
ncbi:hypothetical protein VP01_966g3 [Puccinia sorghi]|uniref:Uncharacterized protein n=1 Tax=Puccinia sorghi TaxID=27349 RepID=A0A0L6U626_9BASI|nr:hypothetical protein VP01_966g3 [Puccinia sorghi]